MIDPGHTIYIAVRTIRTNDCAKEPPSNVHLEFIMFKSYVYVVIIVVLFIKKLMNVNANATQHRLFHMQALVFPTSYKWLPA